MRTSTKRKKNMEKEMQEVQRMQEMQQKTQKIKKKPKMFKKKIHLMAPLKHKKNPRSNLKNTLNLNNLIKKTKHNQIQNLIQMIKLKIIILYNKIPSKSNQLTRRWRCQYLKKYRRRLVKQTRTNE